MHILCTILYSELGLMTSVMYNNVIKSLFKQYLHYQSIRSIEAECQKTIPAPKPLRLSTV